MSDALTTSIQQLVDHKLENLNTAIPATVVSYDAATNMATVRPSLPKRLANDKSLAQSDVFKVPVVFPTSGMGSGQKQAAITMPLTPGDGLKLVVMQRCIADWKSGSQNAPTDPRQFDLSDCVAVPGLNASGVAGHATDLVIRMDKSSVVLKPDNTIVMGNENGSITIAPDGTITLKGESVIVDTPARTFALEVHTHRGVQPGAGNTGVPNP
jgi:hypothetical protein